MSTSRSPDSAAARELGQNGLVNLSIFAPPSSGCSGGVTTTSPYAIVAVDHRCERWCLVQILADDVGRANGPWRARPLRPVASGRALVERKDRAMLEVYDAFNAAPQQQSQKKLANDSKSQSRRAADGSGSGRPANSVNGGDPVAAFRAALTSGAEALLKPQPRTSPRVSPSISPPDASISVSPRARGTKKEQNHQLQQSGPQPSQPPQGPQGPQPPPQPQPWPETNHRSPPEYLRSLWPHDVAIFGLRDDGFTDDEVLASTLRSLPNGSNWARRCGDVSQLTSIVEVDDSQMLMMGVPAVEEWVELRAASSGFGHHGSRVASMRRVSSSIAGAASGNGRQRRVSMSRRAGSNLLKTAATSTTSPVPFTPHPPLPGASDLSSGGSGACVVPWTPLTTDQHFAASSPDTSATQLNPASKKPSSLGFSATNASGLTVSSAGSGPTAIAVPPQALGWSAVMTASQSHAQQQQQQLPSRRLAVYLDERYVALLLPAIAATRARWIAATKREEIPSPTLLESVSPTGDLLITRMRAAPKLSATEGRRLTAIRIGFLQRDVDDAMMAAVADELASSWVALRSFRLDMASAAQILPADQCQCEAHGFVLASTAACTSPSSPIPDVSIEQEAAAIAFQANASFSASPAGSATFLPAVLTAAPTQLTRDRRSSIAFSSSSLDDNGTNSGAVAAAMPVQSVSIGATKDGIDLVVSALCFRLEKCVSPAFSAVESVSLVNLCLDDQRAAALLALAAKLKSLDLRDNLLADATCAILAQTLSTRSCCLEALLLSGNKISNEGAFVLSEVVRRNASLRLLDLRQNRIDSRAREDFLAPLSVPPRPPAWSISVHRKAEAEVRRQVVVLLTTLRRVVGCKRYRDVGLNIASFFSVFTRETPLRVLS